MALNFVGEWLTKNFVDFEFKLFIFVSKYVHIYARKLVAI